MKNTATKLDRMQASRRLGVHHLTVSRLHEEGRLDGHYLSDGRTFVTTDAAVERCRLRLAAESGEIDGLTSADQVLGSYRDSISRVNQLSVLREIELNGLEADAIAAEAVGEPEKATALRELVDGLRRCSYRWDAGSRRWALQVDAEVRYTRPVPLPEAVH